jgi:hypothetical protein
VYPQLNSLEKFVYSVVPDAIPYPFIAQALFNPFRLIALIVGVLLALMIFNRSKKRKYANLIWNTVIGTLFAFGVLLISYVYLFYFLPSPPFWMIMIEASLYFLLYLLLSIFVVLLLLVAPHGFFSRAWNWLVPPR